MVSPIIYLSYLGDRKQFVQFALYTCSSKMNPVGNGVLQG